MGHWGLGGGGRWGELPGGVGPLEHGRIIRFFRVTPVESGLRALCPLSRATTQHLRDADRTGDAAPVTGI